VFGSNFDANFGIPQFPFQGTDPTGGLFGANFSPDSGGSMDTGGLGAVAPPAAPPGPLAPGAGTPNQPPQPETSPPAPAAGIGGQFGGGKL
jgi:hypothetical protein